MTQKSTLAKNKNFEKITGLPQAFSTSCLPQINNKNIPKSNKKIAQDNFLSRNRNALSPNKKSRFRKNSAKKTCNRLVKIPKEKRRSWNDNLDSLTKEEENSCKVHAMLIIKSKEKVDHAKASKFKGFFSPRILRQKVEKFTISK